MVVEDTVESDLADLADLAILAILVGLAVQAGSFAEDTVESDLAVLVVLVDLAVLVGSTAEDIVESDLAGLVAEDIAGSSLAVSAVSSAGSLSMRSPYPSVPLHSRLPSVVQSLSGLSVSRLLLLPELVLPHLQACRISVSSH